MPGTSIDKIKLKELDENLREVFATIGATVKEIQDNACCSKKAILHDQILTKQSTPIMSVITLQSWADGVNVVRVINNAEDYAKGCYVEAEDPLDADSPTIPDGALLIFQGQVIDNLLIQHKSSVNSDVQSTFYNRIKFITASNLYNQIRSTTDPKTIPTAVTIFKYNATDKYWLLLSNEITYAYTTLDDIPLSSSSIQTIEVNSMAIPNDVSTVQNVQQAAAYFFGVLRDGITMNPEDKNNRVWQINPDLFRRTEPTVLQVPSLLHAAKRLFELGCADNTLSGKTVYFTESVPDGTAPVGAMTIDLGLPSQRTDANTDRVFPNAKITLTNCITPVISSVTMSGRVTVDKHPSRNDGTMSVTGITGTYK